MRKKNSLRVKIIQVNDLLWLHGAPKSYIQQEMHHAKVDPM